MANNEWWQSLEQRDRNLLTVGGVIGAVVLLYSTIWAPFTSQIDTLQSSVKTQKANVQWMENAAVEVEQLRHSGDSANANSLGGTSITTLVERTSKAVDLAIKSWQPEGDTKVRVTLDAVPFDKVVTWLADLEANYKVKTSLMTVSKGSEAGIVDVRATLEVSE